MWRPRADAREATNLGRYLTWLAEERGLSFGGYDDLWQWSTTELDASWSALAEHLGVRWHDQPVTALAERRMPGAVWFPGGTLSYAEHALGAAASRPDDVAVVARSQTRPPVEWTWAELSGQVGRLQAGLRRLGVGRGDRVAAYLPNLPETVAAFLATASLGAIWTSCAPEFGTRSVIDRLAQIEPTVLLAVDGYRYGAKLVDRRSEVAAIRAALPGLRATVWLAYVDPAAPRPEGTVAWDELAAEPGSPGAVEHVAVPFDHPLYVLFSSGTTGLPKPIVHGTGSITLEHLKVLALHHDLGPQDRFCWFTTTGWMMWDYLVSGLLVGATIVLFDGDPAAPDLGTLWRMAADTRCTVLGVSAPFLLACRKAGLHPRRLGDLSALTQVGSTGAPLPAEGFRWVHDELGPERPLGAGMTGPERPLGAGMTGPERPLGAGMTGPERPLGAGMTGPERPLGAGMTGPERPLGAGMTGPERPLGAGKTGPDILLSSISGGTDVCTAFLGMTPLTPVWEGEISRPLLGCAASAVRPDGSAAPAGEQGELVITEPMPSMPVGFWGDDDGSRLRAAYFARFPSPPALEAERRVWCHGDWVTFTERGSCVVSGRSDATLNRGGVRLGTADFYAVVDRFPDVADSLVVHLEDGDRLLLFVVPSVGVVLDDVLRRRIGAALRTELSPRHVPDAIEAVPGIPRTLSGKRLEVPVKRILQGTPPGEAAARGSLADPSSLDAFAAMASPPAGHPM